MFGIDDAALAIGGSSIVSGLLGSSSSKRSAKVVKEAAGAAQRSSDRAYQDMRFDLQPFREGGVSALQQLMHLVGIGDPRTLSRERLATERGIRKPTIEDARAAVLAKHRKMFGRGYQASSDMDAVRADEEQTLRSMMAAYNAKLDASGADLEMEPGGDYGSLLRDFSRADFEADPGYGFRLEEGEKALTRAAAARGLAKSTPGLRSLVRFNQGLASEEFGNAFARDQVNKGNKFNFLAQIAGMGQGAAAQTGAAGVNAGATTANALLAAGQAEAGGIMGSASALNNAIQGGLGNFLTMKRFDEMMKRMPVFSTGGFGGGLPGYGG
jgi:hypothetical protein